MNKDQLTRLLQGKLYSPKKVRALELVLTEGLSSYSAEIIAGAPKNTIARLVSSVKKDYQRCLDVSAM